MFRNLLKDVKNAMKYKKAAAHLSEQEYEEAIAICNELMQNDFIGFCRGYGVRASCYHDLEMHKEAMEDATQALEHDFHLAYKIRASSYHNFEMYEEAIADVTSAFEFGVGDVDDIYVRGYSYFEVGKYDEALRDIKVYLSSDEDEITDIGMCIFLYFSALIHNHKGDLEATASDVKKFFYILETFSDLDEYSDVMEAIEGAVQTMKEMSQAIGEKVPYVSFPEGNMHVKRSLRKVISINRTLEGQNP